MKLPILSLLLLFSLGIGILILPQRSFSEEENRALHGWKVPTLASLLDGSFSEDLRLFYSDQLPLRHSFAQIKAAAERWCGKRENNGVLFGRDGYLIPKNEYADLTIARNNLRSAADLAREEPLPVTLLWIPRSTDVMVQAHPSLYDPTYASRILSLIEKVTPSAQLPLCELRDAAASGRQIWYKTDHHWTTHGAFLTYGLLGDTLGYEPYPQEFFSLQAVSDTFRGTSASAVGGGYREADTVILYRYGADTRFTVLDRATGELRNGFYDTGALSQKDQYRVFLGGNTGFLSVRSCDGAKPRLLWIKDSFANSLLPFLALHFDIDLIDPRYYGGDLSQCLTEGGYDQILVEQGIDTLATDPSLSRLLRRGESGDSPS